MAPVNTMPPRTGQVHGGGPGTSKIDPNPSSFNLREFVADEDAANFNSTLWKPIDQQSFVTAQREALEAYNVEKALRLSKATAAEESKRRTAAAAAVDATISISSVSASGTARVVIAPVSEPKATSTTATGRSSVTQSQPIAIKKTPTSSLPLPSDQAAAFSLARSWQVDALQVPLLENKQPVVNTTTTTTTTSSSSSPNMSAKPKSSSTSRSSRSSSPPSSPDKKASAPVSVSPKQRSQNISLSTSSFVDTASVPSHSRVSTSHSNTILSSPQSHRIEQRPLSKRDHEPSSNSSSSRPAVNSDVTNTTPKRPRTERQISTSPPHSRTTSSHVSVSVPPSPDSKKSMALVKDARPGLILNPSKENSVPPTPVEPSHPSRSRPADQASESSGDHQFLTATRNCIKCGNLVSSPRSRVCIFLTFLSLHSIILTFFSFLFFFSSAFVRTRPILTSLLRPHPSLLHRLRDLPLPRLLHRCAVPQRLLRRLNMHSPELLPRSPRGRYIRSAQQLRQHLRLGSGLHSVSAHGEQAAQASVHQAPHIQSGQADAQV
jgi:hypothetical protein